MEFLNAASGDCCNPTQGYQLCGCADGVAYIQLVVVGTTGSNTVWLNTETGETVVNKPAGFLTGSCSDANSKDNLRFSSAAPTGTTPFASPLDGHTTIVTSDGTSAGEVTGYWRYDQTDRLWKEIPIPKATLWVDVAAAPPATGNVPGPRFETRTNGEKYFIDSTGRAELIDGVDPEFAQVVYFNATTPASATIFDDANPPATNDNALKNLENAIYIGTDGSQWTSNGTAYKTYVPSCRPKVKVITANYTLTAADEGHLIYVNSTSAVTVTAPANLPPGFIAEIYQENTGQVTVVGGAGNTLRSAAGFKTRVRHSAIGISYQTTSLSNIVGDSVV